MKLRDLKIKEPPLTEDDGEFIDQLIKLLEPFKTAATVLCGQKYPTVSLIFNYKKLLTLHVTANDLDSKTISRVKAAMLGDLQTRYNDVEPFLVECSLVDPRFRDIQFITDQNRTDALAAIKNRMSTIVLRMGLMRQTAVTQEEAKATADDSDQPPQLNILNDGEQSDDNNTYKEQEPAIVVEDTPEADYDKKPTSALGRLFDVFITKKESSAADKVELELNCYLKESRANMEVNPIDWWGARSDKYPILARVACSYLIIQGTSVASERVFSTTGDLVSAQRACLLPENVDKLVFLKKNLKVEKVKAKPTLSASEAPGGTE